MRYFTFGRGAKSSKSSMYFTLIAHDSLDKPHSRAQQPYTAWGYDTEQPICDPCSPL